MATRKNHHFVPQFYFRRFSADGRSICVLQRHTGKAIPCAAIKSQASKAWFYGEDAVEQALGEIEGACSEVLRELADLQNPAGLSPDKVELTLIWLALQRSRTMAAREASQPMHDKLVRLFLEAEISNSEELDAETRQLLLDNLDAVRTNPVHSQRLGMEAAIKSAGSLSDLTPILLLNKTNRPFIFGDAPVVLHNSANHDVQHRGVLGFETPGLMVFFPLGPSVTLFLVDQATYRLRRVWENRIQVRSLQDVMALNKLQMHAASDCVYFSDFKFAPYVVELWRQERATLRAHACKVIQAPSFSAETGDSLGEIVHSFQPQLPYLRLPELLMHACLVRLTGKAEMPPRPALCVPEAVEQEGLRYVPIHGLVEPARTGFLDWLNRFSEEPVEHPAAPQGIVPETLYVKFLTEAV